MDVVVITFDGTIDDFPVLIQTVDGQIADGTRRLAIDLHALPFINSAAIGYLLGAAKTMEEKGGELALCRVQPVIQRILEMAHVDALLPNFETVDEAVRFLGGEELREAGESPGVQHKSWR